MNSSITITSCIISIHIDNLQNVLSVFQISSNNFSITMVLLKANHTHIYQAVIISKPNNNDIPKPIAAVMMTCREPAIKDVFHMSFIILGCSSIQTINNSRDIHIVEKLSRALFPCNNAGKKILLKIPATIYPMISGCLNSLVIPSEIRTTPKIIPIP